MTLHNKRVLVSVVFSVVVMCAVALAGTVTLPNTFQAGTVARASEVNANFNAVKTAVDDNYLALQIGRVAASPGASCLDIKTRNPAAMDGLYLIDSDGAGTNPPYEVYCDMTRDGGGWTLIMRVWSGSGMWNLAGGYGSPHQANTPKDSPYKLADANVQAIIGTDNNFDILVDQLHYNTTYSNGNHEYLIVRNYTAAYTYTALMAESSTPTVFESFRASDNVLAWRGRLLCGTPVGTSGVPAGAKGINCYNVGTTPNPYGAPNPQGSLGCIVQLSTSNSAGWHTLAQGWSDTDTYVYICNGAQHTSGHGFVHRWWVR